jgi:hypothetical protein
MHPTKLLRREPLFDPFYGAIDLLRWIIRQRLYRTIGVGSYHEFPIMKGKGVTPIDLYGFRLLVDRDFKGNTAPRQLHAVRLRDLKKPGIARCRRKENKNAKLLKLLLTRGCRLLNQLDLMAERNFQGMFRTPGDKARPSLLFRQTAMFEFSPTPAETLVISPDFPHYRTFLRFNISISK